MHLNCIWWVITSSSSAGWPYHKACNRAVMVCPSHHIFLCVYMRSGKCQTFVKSEEVTSLLLHLKASKQVHLANKISTLILRLPWAFNGFYFSSTSIFGLECSFCWLSRIIMPHICCSVESGRPACWERIPSRPTFGKHIHCDWQQRFLLPEEDTGLLTTHSASTHKKKSRCCLLMLIARLRRWGGKNALSLPRQCLTLSDERSLLCCHTAREKRGSIAISQRTDALILNGNVMMKTVFIFAQMGEKSYNRSITLLSPKRFGIASLW